MARVLTAFVATFLLAGITTAAPGDPPPPAEPTKISATITLRDVNIAELIEKLKLELGYKVTGKVTVVANVSVPLGEATTSKAYKLIGKVTASELTLDNLRVSELTADIGYVNGVLTLSKFQAKMHSDIASEPVGEIGGNASAAIEPRGDLKASLTLTHLPLSILFKILPGGIDVAGAVTGKATFQAPIERLSDSATWVGSSNLAATKLRVFGRTLDDTNLKLDVSKGKATLTSLETTIEGVPTTGTGTLTLSGKYSYSASIRTTPKEAAELQKLLPELATPVKIVGKLNLDATASGTLSPFSIISAGSISIDELAVGGTTGEKFSAKWKVTQDRVMLTDISASVFRGILGGSADVPLLREGKGDFQLKFTDIDSAAVAATFPKVPVRLTGRVTGDITGGLPVAKPNESRTILAKVNLSAPKLTVQGIPTEKLVGKLAFEGNALRYELEGKTLGGSFDVKGRYPESKKPDEDEEGSLSIRGIDLDRLTQALRLSGTRLHGVVDLTFHYSADFKNGEGRYQLRGLGIGDSPLISDLTGRLRLRNGSIELADSVGPFTSGTIRARVRARLDEPMRNFYRLDVDRADVSKLLGTLTRRTDLFKGSVSLSVRGKMWPEFTATGTLIMANGRVAGMTATDLRIPFQIRTSSGFHIALRDVTGYLGGGRVTGHIEHTAGVTSRTTGEVKFTSVRVGNLLSDFKQSNYFGNARVTGRININGDNIRTVDDLSATMVAQIEQAALRDISILSVITPFVSPTALLKPFDTGELRGRLSRGVFRIERLVLSSSNAELYAEGNVTLAGRLDLGVIVRTGSVGLNDVALRQLGLTITNGITPLPISIIRDVSVYLSNKTVRLNLTGTISNPQPQLNTAALLTDEAVRFFLRRYLPLAADILPEVSPRLLR